jgi:chromosome segregation ATPase
MVCNETEHPPIDFISDKPDDILDKLWHKAFDKSKFPPERWNVITTSCADCKLNAQLQAANEELRKEVERLTNQLTEEETNINFYINGYADLKEKLETMEKAFSAALKQRNEEHDRAEKVEAKVEIVRDAIAKLFGMPFDEVVQRLERDGWSALVRQAIKF